jgi:hypothetical protein
MFPFPELLYLIFMAIFARIRGGNFHFCDICLGFMFFTMTAGTLNFFFAMYAEFPI